MVSWTMRTARSLSSAGCWYPDPCLGVCCFDADMGYILPKKAASIKPRAVHARQRLKGLVVSSIGPMTSWRKPFSRKELVLGDHRYWTEQDGTWRSAANTTRHPGCYDASLGRGFCSSSCSNFPFPGKHVEA